MTNLVDIIVEGLEKDGKQVSGQTKEKIEEIMRLIDEVLNEVNKDEWKKISNSIIRS